MPSDSRKGKSVYVELPEDLVTRTRELAARNNRPFNAELAHALERHLAAPPLVVVKTPKLRPATVKVEPEE